MLPIFQNVSKSKMENIERTQHFFKQGQHSPSLYTQQTESIE